MKIICISGHSASGKTTTASILSNMLKNSKVISANKFVVMSLQFYKQEFEKIFNMEVDTNNPLDCFLKANDTSAKQLREYMDIILPFVESEIKKEIVEYSKTNITFCIIEWIDIPKTNLWEDADYRIMIDSEKKVRKVKLLERTRREKGVSPYNENRHYNRETAFSETIENAQKIDFYLFNQYNSKLEKDIYQIYIKVL